MTLETIVRRPTVSPHATPLLFIHGAWHGAWCWDEHFLPYFADKGYLSYALSIRSHADSPPTKPLSLNGIWDYVADVAQVADQIVSETGKRPIVIGHSMGGYVVQKYLERHQAPAAVLVASIPVIGTLPFVFRLLRDVPLDFLKTGLMLNGWYIVSTPEKAQRHFFSFDMPLEEVKRHHVRMNGESLRILLDGSFLNRPNPKKIQRTPMLVIAAENDAVFTLDEQCKTAAAYAVPLEIFPGMAHDMMLERDWDKTAAFIATWLVKANL